MSPPLGGHPAPKPIKTIFNRFIWLWQTDKPIKLDFVQLPQAKTNKNGFANFFVVCTVKLGFISFLEQAFQFEELFGMPFLCADSITAMAIAIARLQTTRNHDHGSVDYK